MKKIDIIISGLAFSVISIGLYSSCSDSKKGNEHQSSLKEMNLMGTGLITPTPLAIIPGFNFPENPDTINSWINDPSFTNGYDSASIYKHAWGIWAGLTAPTTEVLGGDSLLVYETWLGLNEVRQAIIDNKSCEMGYKRSGRAPLTSPKQFEHGGLLSHSLKSGNTDKAVKLTNNSTPASGFWVTVSYSPDQACHAISQKVFKQSYINSFYKVNQVAGIPDFPTKSISIKPAYLVFPETATLLQMPVWTNAPSPATAINAFGGEPTFTQFVYVDVNNAQAPNKAIVPVYKNTTNTDSVNNATCNLTDFINFRVDQKMANFMNAQDSIQGLNGAGKAVAGEIALLVGMHVNTKEITNWTWQTYYWTPNPSNPGSPSSKLAARTMPAQLKNTVAGHYAANAAYVMTTPNNNATIDAGPMFGYNPYLEGGFGPSTFPVVNHYNPTYTYGMQSNCMSCHALAIPSPQGAYTTDQYIDTTNQYYFSNQVQLDFAWSIQTALIPDVSPYWQYTPNNLLLKLNQKAATKKK